MGDISWLKAVWHSGPTYVNDRGVLLVLVDCMNVHCRAWPSVQTIADRTGLCVRAVRDRLRSLEADGWITAESKGGGRHRSTTYLVNVNRFGNPAETRQQRPGKKPGRNPAADARNPAADSLNPAADAAERLERLGTSSSGADEDPLPVVVGMTAGLADDDEMGEALDGLSGVAWQREVRAALAGALLRGWSLQQVNDDLRTIDPALCRSVTAVVAGRLRDLGEPPRSAVSPWDLSTWCGECDQTTRWIGEDHPRKCPACHPQFAADRRDAPPSPRATNGASKTKAHGMFPTFADLSAAMGER